MSPGSHLPGAAPPPGMPGQLGPFQILGVLGEGGSGVVYAARWGHREVALKVLHPTLVATDRERARFFSEAKLLAEVTHPGVVKVLNVGQLPDGRPYLAMEKLDGETLASRLSRGAMPVDAALALFDQIAGATAALHQGGLIHRDLKPENVVLTGDGQFAVLLDFGIAKELDAPASTVTQDGGVRGTPAYMAPERFFGQPANPRTDIYELGVLLYAMVTGALPWADHADPTARLNPRRPSDIGVALPGRLEAELLAALSTRPEARPATVVELMQKIVQAYQGVPVAEARRTADISSPHRPDASPGFPQTLPGPPAASPRRQAPVAIATAPRIPARPPADPATMGLPRSAPVPASDANAGGGSGARHYGAFTTPLAHAPTVNAHDTGPGAMSGATTGGAAAASAAARTDTSRARPQRRWVLGAAALAIACVAGGGVWLASSGDDGAANVDQPGTTPPIDAGAHAAAIANDASATTPPPVVPPPITDGTKTLLAPRTGDDSGLATAPQYHPRGTRLLLGFRVRELLRSKAIGPLLLAQRDNPKFAALTVFNRLCSMDFLADIDWVSLGITNHKTEEFDLVIAGNWDRAKIESCLAKNTPGGKGIERHGMLTHIRGDDPTWVGWIDERTLFYSTRAKVTKAWMSERLARKRSAASDPRLASIIKDMKLMSSMWLIGDPDEVSSGSGGLMKGVPDPQTIYGDLALESGLDGRVSMRYADPKAAAKAKKHIAAELTKLRADAIGQMLLGKTNVVTTGRTVRITGQLDPAMTAVLTMAMGEALKQQQKQ